MTDSLQTILGNQDWAPPAELKAIKDYVKEHFNSEVQVGLRDKDIIILVPNSALAGTLRLHIEDIRSYAKTSKKLVIRIG